MNGIDFRGISHQQAVSVLKRCGSTADIVCQYVPEGTAVISITFFKSYYFVTVLDFSFYALWERYSPCQKQILLIFLSAIGNCQLLVTKHLD